MSQDEACAAATAGELRLLEPAVRASPDAVLALLHAEFAEVGVSGRRWDRGSIAAALAAEPAAAPPSVEHLQAQRLAPDVVLVTYLARSPERTAWRSSVWVRAGDRWAMRYHQGTVAG